MGTPRRECLICDKIAVLGLFFESSPRCPAKMWSWLALKTPGFVQTSTFILRTTINLPKTRHSTYSVLNPLSGCHLIY